VTHDRVQPNYGPLTLTVYGGRDQPPMEHAQVLPALLF
jgi:hypothetical protein